MWLFLVTVPEEIVLDNFNYLWEDVQPMRESRKKLQVLITNTLAR